MTEPLEALLARAPRLAPGHVWLAGAGPGDVGLLTLACLSGLRQAEVIVHDALVAPAILDLAQPETVLVFAGKRGGRPSVEQADISAELVRLARAGRRVLRLKGGDPHIFGRGGEEVLALAEQGIPFRVIPGITSGLAALTVALMPATLRGVNQALVLATGHDAPEISRDGLVAGALDWASVARLGQPVVLYMAVTHIVAIADQLMAAGLAPDTPAAAIGSATTPAQRILVCSLATLGETLAAAGLATPAIVVIGAIVATRARLLALLPQLEQEAMPWQLPG